MRKIKGSSRYFTFASMLLLYCMFVLVIGPIITYTLAAPPTVEGITDPVECGASPVWISDLKSVYFIDVSWKYVYKYVPEGKGEFTSTKIAMLEGLASFLVPINAEGNNETTYGLGLVDSVYVFPWDGKNINEVKIAYNWMVSEFITCGKVDSSGRLWVGTSYIIEEKPSDPRGRMFLLGADGTPQKMIEDICPATGIAWNSANDRMYFVDYSKSQIVVNTFKSGPGEIVNDGKVIFDFTAENFTCGPNDMTVDTDGNLWIACLDNNCIVKIDIETSSVAMIVDIPEAGKISSLVFGGLTLEDLYVTSCSSSPMFLVTNTGSKGIAAKTVKAGPPPHP